MQNGSILKWYRANNKDATMIYVIVLISLLASRVLTSSSNADDKHEQAKLNLWLRGDFSFDTTDTDGLLQAQQAPLRHGPIRDVRRRIARDMRLGGNDMTNYNGWDLLNMRGGGSELKEDAGHLGIDKQLIELGIKFGQPFIDAIEKVSIFAYLYCIYRVIYV